MDKEQLIEDLNAILRLEYTAVLQYTYQSFAVRGLHAPHFATLFSGEAAESLTHARTAGEKIVALGGIPTTDVDPISPITDLDAMLRYDLELEEAAVDAYTRALAHAADDPATRSYLEGQIEVEQRSVDEFRRLLA